MIVFAGRRTIKPIFRQGSKCIIKETFRLVLGCRGRGIVTIARDARWEASLNCPSAPKPSTGRWTLTSDFPREKRSSSSLKRGFSLAEKIELPVSASPLTGFQELSPLLLPPSCVGSTQRPHRYNQLSDCVLIHLIAKVVVGLESHFP